MDTSKFKYESIAISGRPGAGRSTLLKNLKEPLMPYGWEFFSGGDWARQFAIKSGKHKASDITHHKATDYSDEIDHQIDAAMRKKLSDPTVHMAVESWIAGWNMRQLPHVLKVLLICDDALRIDRVVNRDNLSVEDAKKHLFDREQTNLVKWKRMYGVDDFWDPTYYDLVVDTYSASPLEARDMVLAKLHEKRS